MIKTKLMLCAESVVRDVDTNTVSAFNLIEEISAPGFPLFVPKLTVLAILERDAADPTAPSAELVMTIDGLQLHKSPVRVEFQDKLRTRAIITYGGVPIPKPGPLIIEMQVAGGETTQVSIAVRLIGTPPISAKQQDPAPK